MINKDNFEYTFRGWDEHGNVVYSKTNHYSCFGLWPSTYARLGVGVKGRIDNRLAFSCNFEPAFARRLIRAMRKCFKGIRIDGVTYKRPPINFYLAGSTAPGSFTDMKFNYVTVTLPAGIPLDHVYPLVKPMVKALCSTQKHTSEQPRWEQLLDESGEDWMISMMMNGMFMNNGGYTYPMNGYGMSFAKAPIITAMTGWLDYGDVNETCHRSRKYKPFGTICQRAYRSVQHGGQIPAGGPEEELPVVSSPGFPALTVDRKELEKVVKFLPANSTSDIHVVRKIISQFNELKG